MVVSGQLHTPCIIEVIKSRRLRWAGQVIQTGDEKCTQYFGGKTWKEETTRKTKV
jgi:hypothetical protein